MSGKSCGKRKRRPRKRGSCGGRRKVRRLVLVPLVTAAVLFSAIFVYLQAVIDPNLEDISRMRAEVLVTRTINRALSELFQEQTVEEDLFLLKKDENGNVVEKGKKIIVRMPQKGVFEAIKDVEANGTGEDADTSTIYNLVAAVLNNNMGNVKVSAEEVESYDIEECTAILNAYMEFVDELKANPN